MAKKLIPFAVVFCMMFSLVFAGCGDAKTSSGDDTGSKASSEASVSSDASSDASSNSDSTAASSDEVVSSDSVNSVSSASSQSQVSSTTSAPATKPKPTQSSGASSDANSSTGSASSPTTDSTAQQIVLYTHNVCSHGDGGQGASNRLPYLSKLINENAPNITVLLECNTMWAKSVAKTCGYERADNARTGLSEIQILYKSNEFELVENYVDNSDRSAYHWAILKSKKTSEKFIVYAYHGTVQGDKPEVARYAEFQAMLKLTAEKKLPAILTGDFNTTRESDEYKLTESGFEHPAKTAELKYDGYTWLGWKGTSGSIIDQVLYSKGDFTAKKYTVLDQAYDGVILSDHCALLSTLEMK